MLQLLLYICEMKRKVIAFGNYYHEFIRKLSDKERGKLKYLLSLLETQDRVPVKFIKSIKDGLFELRMEYESNIYRIFFIFDGGNIVVLFNCFQKKTQKTPRKEIDKALKLKAEYYEQKKSTNL